MIYNNLLLDTNIIVYYFNGLVSDKRIDDILKKGFNISIITKIEFLSWQKLYNNDKLLEKARSFISHATIYGLTDKVANTVIEIRQQHRIKTPDAIIGATALVHGLDIATNNIDDFKHLDLDILSVEVSL